jgi:hypothetical protein
MIFHDAKIKIYLAWKTTIDAVRATCEYANHSLVVFLVWDIWDKGRRPQPATLKHASIYDYYDILEEIGR